MSQRSEKQKGTSNRQRGCDMRQSNPPNSQYRGGPPAVARIPTSRGYYGKIRYVFSSCLSFLGAFPSTLIQEQSIFATARSRISVHQEKEPGERDIHQFLVLSKSINLLAWLNSVLVYRGTNSELKFTIQ